MDERQLQQLKPELDRFLDGYVPLFGHDANAAHGRRFVQGLLHKGERRSVENIAEAIEGGSVRNLQAFITTGACSDVDILAQMRRERNRRAVASHRKRRRAELRAPRSRFG